MWALVIALLIQSAQAADQPCDQDLTTVSWSSPTYPCLPERIVPHFAVEDRWIPFESGYVEELPLSEDYILLDGKKQDSKANYKALHDLFDEEHYARLPEGQTIVERLSPAGQPVWNYPVGTSLAHVVFWKGSSPNKRDLFEVRLIQKLPSGLWAYGAYEPIANSEQLLLRKDGYPKVTQQILLWGSRREVTLWRVDPSECRECHIHHHGDFAIQDLEGVDPNKREFMAGPCGFTPANPGFKMAEWIKSFREKLKTEPVSRVTM